MWIQLSRSCDVLDPAGPRHSSMTQRGKSAVRREVKTTAFFGGYTTHALYGKRAYYHLASLAGVSPQVSVSGPTSLSGGESGTFSATVSGGRASSSYYFEWTFKCTPRSTATGECNGEEFELDEGWGLTSLTIDAPVVDGTALVTARIRETATDSPVSPAYADKASKKFSVSRF